MAKSDTRAPKNAQFLTASGAGESVSSKLRLGEFATLIVGGANAVHFVINGSSAASGVVTTTGSSQDVELAAGSRFDWVPDPETCFVHLETDASSGTHEAWVWTSGD